ncbi:MAG: antibiotic biosynthesis monooxygenase family protein [Cyanobacteria bacterium J06633_2]
MTLKKIHYLGFLTTLLLSLWAMASTNLEVGITSVQPANAQALEQSIIVEVATFKLKEGITSDEFYAVDQAVETQHVSQQPGFISRESAVSDDNEWLVIVHWRSIEDAEASMASFSSAPATAEFMSKLEVDTMVMKRYTSYGLHD